MPKRIITMAALKEAVTSSYDFEGFVQRIVEVTIKRALDWRVSFTPDDAEKEANLLFATYEHHYLKLVESFGRAPSCKRCGADDVDFRRLPPESPPLCHVCFETMGDAEYQRLGGVL